MICWVENRKPPENVSRYRGKTGRNRGLLTFGRDILGTCFSDMKCHYTQRLKGDR
ncbi:rCG57671, isoform CRA_b [Rattus norvegicus]|uniref:RCG57671, isoform CRA_b n=1 Tax=Rattus norvegicus TaxID=10116 RepID=A6JI94_RAT|nr:rCG57671, isoform CRA_b [Rattus norvegicus]